MCDNAFVSEMSLTRQQTVRSHYQHFGGLTSEYNTPMMIDIDYEAYVRESRRPGRLKEWEIRQNG